MNETFDNSTHYSQLLADWYDLLLAEETGDVEYYRDILQNSGQPVLELACGTGRLLVPFLESGMDIDGMDSSAAMLEKCETKTKRLDASPTLYHQKMQQLKPNRSYKTVFIAGASFQLLDKPGDVTAALNNIYRCLEPGGRFILDLFIPWKGIQSGLNGAWRLGRTATGPGNTMFAAHHSDTYDLAKQVVKGAVKYEVYKDNRLVDSYMDRLDLKWYSINEFKLLLEKTGFIDVKTEPKHLIDKHGEATVYFASKP
ncbi:MAG: class I SAM-dependent methyltransferase [bacterium]|nr:class I SAM-dependent methyltransferase [bacterium]